MLRTTAQMECAATRSCTGRSCVPCTNAKKAKAMNGRAGVFAEEWAPSQRLRENGRARTQGVAPAAPRSKWIGAGT